MASEMGCTTFVASLWILFALSDAAVEMSSIWKPDLGWQVTCSWKLFANDSLQSVRLFNANMQFMIYRPEKDGPKCSKLFKLPESTMQVDCEEITKRGSTGICVLTQELFQPPSDEYSYNCEVSGEGPMFRIEHKDIVLETLVPPSDATIEVASAGDSNQVTLNCSSSGLPPPKLSWTAGEEKISTDKTYVAWNVTSKLWQVWSSLNHTYWDQVPVTCKPEMSKGNQSIIGKFAQYNSACAFSASNIIMAVLLSVTLLR